jgi:hypothetical protein
MDYYSGKSFIGSGFNPYQEVPYVVFIANWDSRRYAALVELNGDMITVGYQCPDGHWEPCAMHPMALLAIGNFGTEAELFDSFSEMAHKYDTFPLFGTSPQIKNTF